MLPGWQQFKSAQGRIEKYYPNTVLGIEQPYWRALWHYILIIKMCVTNDPAVLPMKIYPIEMHM